MPMLVPPPISLVIPTHNREDLIIHTIESALSQTVQFAEIIVVDDASTDETLKMLGRFGQRINVIASEKIGVQGVRNKGVAASQSEYVTLCDSDDLLQPDFVERIGKWLAANKAVDSIYSNFVTFDNDGVSAEKFSAAPPGFFAGAKHSAEFITDIPDLYQKTIIFQPLFSSGVTVKKSFYFEIGGYNPAFNNIGSEDWEYTLRAVAQGVTAVCTAPLVRIRRHGKNDSSDSIRQLFGEVTVLEHARATHPFAKQCLEELLAGIERRRIDIFELAFGTKKMGIALTVLPLIRQEPRSLKFRVKAVLTNLHRYANRARARTVSVDEAAADRG